MANDDADMSQQVVKVKKELPGPWEISKLDDDLNEEDAPKNFGGPLPSFKWLCESLFDKLDKAFQKCNYYSHGRATVTEQKQRIIELFFKEWRLTVGPNIYPALCLILPHKDRSRIYNIKDYTLGRRILEVLKIPKNSETTTTIMKWKRSRSAKAARMSDICIDVIQARRTDNKGGKLSISEVNEILDKLARFDSKREEQLEILTYLMENMCFMELHYFFDIVLKKNVVRNMENRLLNAWHPDAQKYLSVVTSLKTVAYKLPNPTILLNDSDLSINLAKPFSPQLALKPHLTYARIVQKLQNDFFVEEKMDGERIQVHFENYGETIHYWSRKATDYTYLYGENSKQGCISPHLKFIQSVQSCVLDGEMITYDPQRNAILPFGVLKGSAVTELQRLEGGGDESQLSARPLYIVFDLLYLNGKSLANVSLEKRKEWLSKVLIPTPQFVEIIEAKKADSEEEVKTALTRAIERGSEGVVLKQVRSFYQIDKRSDQWVKIKPEYLEEFGENVDLVVIGREKSKKDMYYCGLRVSDEDTDVGISHKFWCFCRVANGFDKDEYREIERITRGKWKDFTKEKPPSDLLEFGKRDPQEWIDPRESFVIEVKARSIDRSISKNYKTSTTLYNAYNRKIRDDKDWKTAATLADYRAIKESRTSIKSSEQKIVSKKKRLIRKRQRESQDEEVWNQESFAKISRSSHIFQDLTFMVLSDAFYQKARISIEDLTSIIHKNGGKFTKNETTVSDWQNLRIISDKYTIQADALKKKGFDILKSSWFFKCVETQGIIPLEPKYCFKVSETLGQKVQTRVDSLGDSYTVAITQSELAALIEENQDTVDDVEVDSQLWEVDLFHGLNVYVSHIHGSKVHYLYDQAVLQLTQFGGSVVDVVNDANLVVVPRYAEHELVSMDVGNIRKKLSEMVKFGESSVTTVRIVSDEWIDACIKENVQVDTKKYPVISERN